MICLGKDTYVGFKLQAVDLEVRLDGVELVQNSGTELFVVGERVRSP